MCYKICFLELFSIIILNNSLQIRAVIQLFEHLIMIGFYTDLWGLTLHLSC